MSIKAGRVIVLYAIATVTGRDQSLDFISTVGCHCDIRIYVVQPILLQEITLSATS